MEKSVIFYEVLIPDGEGDNTAHWHNFSMEGDEETIYTNIRDLHPRFLQYQIMSIGEAKFSENAGLGPFRVSYGEEYYSESEEDLPEDSSAGECPPENAVRAEFYSCAMPPEAGWWPLHLIFTSPPSSYYKFMVQIIIYYDNIFNPRHDIRKFLYAIKRNQPASVTIIEDPEISDIES